MFGTSGWTYGSGITKLGLFWTIWVDTNLRKWDNRVCLDHLD